VGEISEEMLAKERYEEKEKPHRCNTDGNAMPPYTLLHTSSLLLLLLSFSFLFFIISELLVAYRECDTTFS